MFELMVVLGDVIGDVGSGRAHAVIGPRIEAFVFDRSPDALDKDIVAPGAEAIHGQLHPLVEDRIKEFLGGELGGFNRSSQHLIVEQILETRPSTSAGVF